MRLLASILAASIALGCTAAEETSPAAPAPAPLPPPPAETEGLPQRLARYLSGDFDSADQATRDKEYFPIHLSTCSAALEDESAPVLYVEQAFADQRDAPYRQRIYLLESIAADGVRSRVFELASPSTFIGACARALVRVQRSELVERDGCAVNLRWLGERFVGHTGETRWDGQAWVPDDNAKKCPSELRGATYATSAIDLDGSKLLSWDRGFDGAGAQVWGARKGAYEFVRRTNLPSPTVSE